MYVYASPIGKLGISVDEKGLRKIEFLGHMFVNVWKNYAECNGEGE